MTPLKKPPKQRFGPAGWTAVAFGVGLLPVLPIWLRGSPLLLNDLLVAYYAYFADFHRNWAWNHPLPLWSGSYQCGMPMHAYWQSGYLYPLTWVLFGPFDPGHTIYLFYGLHFGLAIAGFLVLGPELGLIRLASFWSGLAFGLSGTLLARYEHATFLSGWSYLPLVLGLYLRLERAPSPRGVLWLALALSLQTLGGHPQATLVTAALLGLFFLRGLCTLTVPRKYLAAPVAAAALALLLCLPLFVPFLDFLGQTDRYDGAAWEGKAPSASGAEEKLSEGVFGFEKFSTGGFRPAHFLSLVLPRALGTPAQASWWGGEPWTEVFLFIGAAGLLAGLFASSSRAGLRMRWLWLCGLIGLWLAFGAHLGASQLLYHIPILNNFRRPARWIILFVLALAALSGQGFQRWLAGAKSPERLWIASGVAAACFLLSFLASSPGFISGLLGAARQLKHLDASVDYSAKLAALVRGWRWDFFWLGLSAAGFALRFRLGARRLAPLLLLMLSADLLRIHWQHFYPFPSDYYRAPPRSLASLEGSTGPFWRVAHYLEYPGTEMWQMHHNPLRRMDLFEREKLSLAYGVHAVFGIRNIGAHMPLLWPWDTRLTPGEKSARYFLSNRDLPAFHGSPLRPMARYDSVRVYEVLDWKPRIALLPGSGSITETAPAGCPPAFSGYGGLCVSEPWDGNVRVSGNFRAGDTLVFREHWHRGWRVREGGDPGGKGRAPERFAGAFMAHVFGREARFVEWTF